MNHLENTGGRVGLGGRKGEEDAERQGHPAALHLLTLTCSGTSECVGAEAIWKNRKLR